MSYAQDHASALADITKAGAAVTFTPLTGSAVSGAAIQDMGSAREYADLGLVQRDTVTLWFAPSTYGERPGLTSTFTWGSGSFTVAYTEPVAPDGSAIIVKVIGSR